jgi:uncharacterized membrane protein
MLCPRCNTTFEERFCPRCGLDLQIYTEMEQLKSELESLRQLVAPTTQHAILGIAAALADAKSRQVPQIGKTPPPLPHPATKPGDRKTSSRESSAEIALGQKWFLGIGVLIVIIGFGFFLKYAFDQQWIGPAVRISLGFVSGVVLLMVGSIFHSRNLRGLDVGIVAVGLGALHLSGYAASQVDRLLPGSLALVLILLTTAIGAILASLWASQALAILTFLGGYLAPLLLASAQFDPWLYLGYLLILTLGAQILAYAKDWNHLYSSGAALTWLSLTVWSQRDYKKEWFPETFVFTQVLFVAYSIMPFLRSALRKGKSWSQGFPLAVVNGLLCCWYSASLLDYQKIPGSLVSVSYAIVTLGLALVFWRRRTPDLFSSWLIAQALVFFLVFWAQFLTDTWVTLFWSAELVVLYWVAAKCNDRMLLLLTFLVGLLVVLRYHYVYTLDLMLKPAHLVLFTVGVIGRWIAGSSMVIALLLVAWLDRTSRVAGSHPGLNRAFEFIGVTSLFVFANLELYRFTNQFMYRIQTAGLSVLWSVFAVGLMLVGIWMRRKVYRIAAIGLLISTVLKVLAYDTAEVSTPYRILSCIVLGSILMAVSFLYHRYTERLTGK